MHVSSTRFGIASTLLATLAGLFASPGSSHADDRDLVFRPGVYQCQWHGDKVKIIVEKVHGDRTFSGSVHFDKSSNFPDARFEFTGKIGRHESITITREANCPQVARAGEPRRENGHMIWKGEVSEGNLDKPYPFELRIPLPR
jgi:hypothetical protein